MGAVPQVPQVPSDEGPHTLLADVRRELFCQEMLVDGATGQAAVRAGWAAGSGYMLMKEWAVKQRIDYLLRERMSRTGITAERVITELARIGFANVTDVFTPNGAIRHLSAIEQDTSAAIASVKVTKALSGDHDEDGQAIYNDVVEVKMHSKIDALKKLGEHLQIFDNDGAQVQIGTVNITLGKRSDEKPVIEHGS